MASELQTFVAVDPATGECGPEFLATSEAQVVAAATAAALVHADGILRDPSVRATLLRVAARNLRDDGAEIIAVSRLETGLPEPRLAGELERTASQLEKFAVVVDAGDEVDAIIDLANPDARPLPAPDVRRMLLPIGPVAVFGASNFPLAFGAAGGDTASALAAGCPVIVKGHPSHPGTSQLVAAAISRALQMLGLPTGVYTLLQSAGHELGLLLVEQPVISAVAFTGSFEAGRALERAAAARRVPIPVFAEMGSINPVVVTEGALRQRGSEIAAGLAAAVTGSGGQLCTKPGVVLLPAGDEAEQFIADVAQRLDATEPAVLLNAGVQARLARELERLEALRVTTSDDEALGPGFRQRPVAARARAAELRSQPGLLHEFFGPFVLLVTYDDEPELAAVLHELEGQLTAALHGAPDETDLLARLAEILRHKVGRLVFNGFATGVAVNYAMQHGGPFPATTAPATTSVGMTSLRRFLRPVAWQDAPEAILPPELQSSNPLGIGRRVNGVVTAAALASRG
jgi:2,5-dioxopentanoate dehydrogenase